MPPQRDEKGRFVEQMYRSFTCYTNGSMPELDRLVIISECFEEMEPNEVAATLGWINSKYGGRQWSLKYN